MEVLSRRHPGLFFICEQCGALIGDVHENEIYNGFDVYCIVCKYKNRINYDKSYDGVMKDDSITSSN